MNHRLNNQQAFLDWATKFSFARINLDNRWVKLTKLVPWYFVDQLYVKYFVDSFTSHPAIENQNTFGALIVKQEFWLSDKDLVQMISLNPYVQYFSGQGEFTGVPIFNSDKMVFFCKGFPPEAMVKITEAIIIDQKVYPTSAPITGLSGDSEFDNNENAGILILVTTCAPANIHFTTETGLLNDALEASERMDDACYEHVSGKIMPRYNHKKDLQRYFRIVRNNNNLPYYNFNGLKMYGQPGRLPMYKTLINEKKWLKKTDAGEQNTIEGKYREAMQCYSLDRGMTHLSESSESVNHLIVVFKNHNKMLRDLFVKLFEDLFFGHVRFRSALLAVM